MANKTTMTKANFFTALANYAAGKGFHYTDKNGEDFELTEEVIFEFANHQLEVLAKTAEHKAAKAAEKRAEADALTLAVQAVLTGEFQTAEAITALVEGEDVTKGKVQARLTKLVAAGVAVKAPAKVEKRTLMTYALATEVVASAEDAE